MLLKYIFHDCVQIRNLKTQMSLSGPGFFPLAPLLPFLKYLLQDEIIQAPLH